MNILVVRNDKLGDFITALPTFYVLKKYNPNNKIIALVAPLTATLANECSFIDEVIVDVDSTLELSHLLKAHNIDASITLFSNTHVALAQFLARISIRIAPATKIVQYLYTKRIKQRRSRVEMAEFEYNLQLAKALFSDIALKIPSPLLEYDNSVYKAFCEKEGITKKVCAFHVGFGGSSDANWSEDEYVELINEAKKMKDVEVILTFGPDESELMQRMQSKLKWVKTYQSREGLVEFAKLISHFDLFVSTSTGTFHLASLVGTPTLTFFGDSLFASSRRWRGIGDINIQRNIMIPKEVHKRKELFDEIKENFNTSYNR